MVLDPVYWLLVPIGILIAIAYTSTGISGANFWVPVFALGLGLDPRVAFWLALVAMLFGSSSGLIRHGLQRTMDLGFAGRLLLASLPGAVVGSLIAPGVPPKLLGTLFGAFALVYGAALLGAALSDREPAPAPPGPPIAMAFLGGFLTGLISVGVGALLVPRLLRHPRFEHHARAVGTTLAVVFPTSLAAALVRLGSELLGELRDSLPELLAIMAFVVPAVVVGGQLGPLLARWVERRTMRLYAAGLLVLVGVLMIARFS